MELHNITYKKKIVALELFENEFRAFHDFVEGMLQQINDKSIDIQPGQSFQSLEGLAKYKNGEIISTMIIGKEAITFRISNDNDPNSEAKRFETQSIPNNITSFRWEFK